MKGLALAFGAILGILVITSVVILYITATGEVRRGIVTTEGKIISFVNEAEIFTKTFNQSIEFISQRAAYDLGKTGGFYDGDGLWDYFYPRLDILEKNLEIGIKDNLPSEDIVDGRIIKWYETDVDTSPIGFLETSKGFSVEGNKTFYLYDESIETKVSHDPFEIKSSIVSSYYKLLYVGRQVLENENYNSTLHDVGNLSNLLESDFPDLDFEITASEDIVDINIEDNTCMIFYDEYYCIAPLKPEEDGIIDDPLELQNVGDVNLDCVINKTDADLCTAGDMRCDLNGDGVVNVVDAAVVSAHWLWECKRIPYNYLKLKFKINATQTSFTPPTFDFGLEVVPPSGAVDAGDSLVDINLLVRSLSGETKPVHLDYEVVSATTGVPEPTITVLFDANDKEPNYVSTITINTETWTLSDNYNVIIIGTADGIEKKVVFILTVNPIMKFSLEAVPDRADITQGDTTITTININFIGGTPVPVFLSSSSLPGSTITFLPSDSCTPTCSLNMRIETLDTVPTGDYVITVTGIGGGVMNTTKFTLSIYPPFDYNIHLTPDSMNLLPGEYVEVGIRAEKIKGISEAIAVVLEGNGTTEPTITIDLIPSDTCTPAPVIGLPSDCDIVMNITTQDGTAAHTPFGNYIIDVVPNGDLTKSKTFILSVVPPAFDFTMSLNSYDGTVDPGDYKEVTVTITKTNPIAIAEEVSLSSGVTDGADASTISVDFNPISCTPDPTCTSTMRITTQGAPNPTDADDYYIDVYGSNGGHTRAPPFAYVLTVNQLFDFSISLDSYSKKLYKGEFVEVTVTIQWLQGTPQQVDLSPDIRLGDGTQLSITFNPNRCIPNPTCTSTMNISTSDATTPRDYWIYVIGDSFSAGVTKESGRYELTVEEFVSFDFSISVSPPQDNVMRGDSRSATITVTKLMGSEDEEVTISCSEPGGLSVSCSPSACTPLPTCTSTLAVTTHPTTTPGDYTITVTGTSASATHSVNYILTVEAITISFKSIWPCNIPYQNPIMQAGLVFWSEYRGGSCAGKSSDVVESNVFGGSNLIVGAYFDGSHADNEVGAILMPGPDPLSPSHNNSFIWQSIGDYYLSGISRAAECCPFDESHNFKCFYLEYDPHFALKRSDAIYKIAGVLNEADQNWEASGTCVDGKCSKPYSNFRKAWCGDSNINCLLCFNRVVKESAWYVCNGEATSVPRGIILSDVGKIIGESAIGCWQCTSSGNWVSVAC